jgi:hypothetical protein
MAFHEKISFKKIETHQKKCWILYFLAAILDLCHHLDFKNQIFFHEFSIIKKSTKRRKDFEKDELHYKYP